MRTRTLLLLAVGCGLLILAAGVVQLLRIAGQDDPPQAAAVGAPIRIGDLTVTVDDLAETAGQAVVVIELGGVDDPDGTDEFRLVVPGAALRPTTSGDEPCRGTTVATQRCNLTFDVSNVEGSSRVLLYRRGEQQVRWELTEA